MAQTKNLLCYKFPEVIGNEIFRFLSPSKKRKRNGCTYYLSCCYLGLFEEFQRLRKKFPSKDDDALCQAICGNNFELVRHMIDDLDIRDERQNSIECAVENDRQEILEFLIHKEDQWFRDNPNPKKFQSYIDHMLYLGACSDNEFLVRYALDNCPDELDEAEYFANKRGHHVAILISNYIDQL